MSAYMVSALIAAIAGLIGYFNLLPGAFDFLTEYGRARGTFKDPNVLGAFLVPALLYGFNAMMSARLTRAGLWLGVLAILLLASLLTFSRGAWINLAVSLGVYAFFVFATAPTNRQRLKLVVLVVLAGVVAVGVFAAAQSIPKVAELMTERASLDQSYDVGPDGRFGGQKKAAGIIGTHPLGIGADVFSDRYHHEDAHEVYLSMFLNTGLDRRHALFRGGAADRVARASASHQGQRGKWRQRGAGRGLYRHGARGARHRQRPLAPFLPGDGNDLGRGAGPAIRPAGSAAARPARPVTRSR